MYPCTRATSLTLFTEAVLPVASRYGVTVCCTGSWTVTFGGGGATSLFGSPHALSRPRIAAQASRDNLVVISFILPVPLAATAARAIRKPRPDHATEHIDFPRSRVRTGYEPVD